MRGCVDVARAVRTSPAGMPLAAVAKTQREAAKASQQGWWRAGGVGSRGEARAHEVSLCHANARSKGAMMDSDDERDDLKELIAEFSAKDPAFPVALAAAEERLAIMTRLKAARKAAGLSRAAVAARMGTSESAVARMEGGALDARISTVARFAAAVGVRLQVAAAPARPPRKAA